LFWESAGDRLWFSKTVSVAFSAGASSTFAYQIDYNPSNILHSGTRASTKS